MGRTQHLQPPLAPPLLGNQLLARVNREAVTTLLGPRPGVAAGPDPAQAPDLTDAGTQQQGTTFLGLGAHQDPAQNGEQART